MRHWKPLLAATILVSATFTSDVPIEAQIVTPQVVNTPDRYATLTDQLVNRLRATRTDQQDYITLIVNKVKAGELDTKLVIAVERYAMKRNPSFPFPFFERALRYEAAKRGIALPTVMEIASTAVPHPRR